MLCGSWLGSSGIRILSLSTLGSLEAKTQTTEEGGQLRSRLMIHISALHHPSSLSRYQLYVVPWHTEFKKKKKRMFVCRVGEIHTFLTCTTLWLGLIHRMLPSAHCRGHVLSEITLNVNKSQRGLPWQRGCFEWGGGHHRCFHTHRLAPWIFPHLSHRRATVLQLAFHTTYTWTLAACSHALMWSLLCFFFSF